MSHWEEPYPGDPASPRESKIRPEDTTQAKIHMLFSAYSESVDAAISALSNGNSTHYNFLLNHLADKGFAISKEQIDKALRERAMPESERLESLLKKHKDGTLSIVERMELEDILSKGAANEFGLFRPDF